MITTGLVALLFVSYQVWFTNAVTAAEQRGLSAALQDAWRKPSPAGPTPIAVAATAPGDPVGILRIPRLGADWSRIMVEGTGTEELKKGPGRISESTAFGELGNTVVSGHRTTYGAPFVDLDRLQAGDSIIVETQDEQLTYRVTGSKIVLPTAVEVTLPVPERPGIAPTTSLLTLTTCNPKYSARQRLIIFSELVGRSPRG